MEPTCPTCGDILASDSAPCYRCSPEANLPSPIEERKKIKNSSPPRWLQTGIDAGCMLAVVAGFGFGLLALIGAIKIYADGQPNIPADVPKEVLELPPASGLDYWGKEGGIEVSTDANRFRLAANQGKNLKIKLPAVRTLEGAFYLFKSQITTDGALNWENTFSTEPASFTGPFKSSYEDVEPELKIDLPVYEEHLHKNINVSVKAEVQTPVIGGSGYTVWNQEVSRQFSLYIVSPEEMEVANKYWNRTSSLIHAGAIFAIGLLVVGVFGFLLYLGVIEALSKVKAKIRSN